MVAQVFREAFDNARTESRQREQDAGISSALAWSTSSALAGSVQGLTETVAALRTENAALQLRTSELGDALAAAREALGRSEAQAMAHRDQASQASAVAERERARADAEALAARGARELADREREARMVAESKPPTIIREPAQVIAAPSVSAAPTVPAPVLPEPPRKLRMHIKARDPNGLITDVDWIPGE